ncbi:hypothetical protein ACGH52_00290 [Streptomyces sp. BBFR25]|uniref:hypothetical protein n=1 Tax=Streptomyces sp. BBFR25 TaxID=3372855 RepID=UPI0037DCDBFF
MLRQAVVRLQPEHVPWPVRILAGQLSPLHPIQVTRAYEGGTVPFGSGDRAQLQQILDQLSRLATEVAAIKQQAADQQHTLDQLRHDTTAAINSGLADIRSVARDAMTRTTDLVGGPLTQVSNEIVAIRSAVTQIDGQLRATASHATAAPEPAPAADPEPPSHPLPGPDPEPVSDPEAGSETEAEPSSPDPAVLRAAAGIAHAIVEAHRDTWAFLIQTAGNEQHFHIPGKVDDHEGFVSVRFSGPSLVAALTSLNHIAQTAANPVTQAIASHIQQKITAAVHEIITHPSTDGEGKPVRIVIDDRAAPAEPAHTTTAA